MELQAEVLPVGNRKYYGTIISLLLDGHYNIEFKVWSSYGDPTPSAAELDPYDREDWDNNILIPDGWDGKYLVPIQRSDLFCDGHYQTQGDLDLANEIVRRLNRKD